MLHSKTKGSFLHGDMKFNAYRIIFTFGLLILLYSCSKDENTGDRPRFQIVNAPGYIGTDTTVSGGSLMHFKVIATEADYPLTNFFIEVDNFADDRYRLFDTAFYLSDFVWEGSFYKSSDQHQFFTFVIRDRQGNSNGDMLTIFTDSTSTFNPIESITGIKMGAQGNTESGGFYSLSEQQVFSLQDAKANQLLIDLVFYYGEDELTLASPGANIESGIFPENLSPVNWNTRNTTRFIKTGLTDEDFNNTMNDSIMIASYIDADGKRKAKALTAGDIYVFKNQLNRLGVFRVNQATEAVEGEIDIDIKIQKLGK